jgi:hypothetical protein
MNFQVLGDASIGPISPSQHATADEALAKAIDLMTKGMINVYIVDVAGRYFTPSELAHELDKSRTEGLDGA